MKGEDGELEMQAGLDPQHQTQGKEKESGYLVSLYEAPQFSKNFRVHKLKPKHCQQNHKLLKLIKNKNIAKVSVKIKEENTKCESKNEIHEPKSLTCGNMIDVTHAPPHAHITIWTN